MRFTYVWFSRLAYLLTYSMQHSPSWEANRFSANQEIPRILWNPNVHYRSYKSRSSIPFLSGINAVHAPIPRSEDPSEYYIPIYFWVFRVALSLRFTHQNPVLTSPFPHTPVSLITNSEIMLNFPRKYLRYFPL